jgi:hypothetical protein
VATRAAGDRDLGPTAERMGDRLVGRHDETRMGLLTSEFWVAVIVAVATLIAAAVSNNLDAHGAWWIVGVIATGYIISRGLAKIGRGHWSGSGSDRDIR